MLVFSLPDFIFYLKEGVLSMSYMLFFATPFLHNEVLRKLDFLPIEFLEVPCDQTKRYNSPKHA
jgi:hypothetical protein